MESLPLYLTAGFAVTVAITVFLLVRSARFDKKFLFIVLTLTGLQILLSLTGFYTNFAGKPPRTLLLVLPPLLLMGAAFSTMRGRNLLNRLNAGRLTALHTIRIPVELVLLGLAGAGVAPWLITFEGGNFDILSGLSAPLVWYFGYHKRFLPRVVLILWNIGCLTLLGNVVFHALLSAPTIMQHYSFEQPLVAIGYAPFTLLPAIVVPAVLLAHLASLRQLLLAPEPGKASGAVVIKRTTPQAPL